MNKTIFMVEYWVPFPYSEYGGVYAVIADDEGEAAELLAALDLEYEKEEHPDYLERIKAKVKDAIRFPVFSPVSQVVYQFTT